MIKDPELIKQIAIKDFDVFAERNAFVPEDVDPLWANGLFATRGTFSVQEKCNLILAIFS